MSRTVRYLLVIGVVLAAVVMRDVIFVGHVLPRMLIQPTPDAIVDTFVEAITTGDLDLALTLTDGTPDCVANMTRTFEWYSPKYRGVPVDEIILSYYPNFAQKSRETKAWSRSLTTEVDRSWR